MKIDRYCPECDEELSCVEVDIGVGTMYGPPYCNNCGWSAEDVTKEFKVKESD